jgi:hypothetical protein
VQLEPAWLRRKDHVGIVERDGEPPKIGMIVGNLLPRLGDFTHRYMTQRDGVPSGRHSQRAEVFHDPCSCPKSPNRTTKPELIETDANLRDYPISIRRICPNSGKI